MVATACAAFDLDAADAELADIWFCEQVVGRGDAVRLTLAERDLIVRLRRRGDRSDSTLKFRRQAQPDHHAREDSPRPLQPEAHP